MKTIKRFLKLTAMTATVLTAVLSASCESSGDSLDNIEIPEYVERPVKAVKYEQSAQFKDDLEAVNQLAFVLRALNWDYWMMASNGLNSLDDFFTVEPENLGKDQPKLADEYLEILSFLYNNVDKYQDALNNLQYNGMFTPNVTTRGLIPFADGIDFGIACKNSAIMGRKTVMAVIRLGGWSTDAQMLTKLYNQIPKENRRGYSDAITFWEDFSAGKLDDRSNQIFKNLYSANDDDQALRFADKCNDLGISPETNMSIVTQKMAQSGINLIIDACPINIGSGVDIYNTTNATMDVFTNSLKFSRDKDGKLVYEGFNEETFKTFVQQWGHNVMKYGRDFEKTMDKIQSKFNEVNYTNWDPDVDWWYENVFQDYYEFSANEAMFSDNFREAFNDNGKKLGLQTIVKVKEVNGKPISYVYLYDPATGKIRIGFTMDDEGNLELYAGENPGTKTITVVNRQTGKRITKKVEVRKDEETEVEVDLEYDEELLEENPKNGELKLYPGTKLTDNTGEGGSSRFTIVTNYLYYKCEPVEDWITASIPSDANFLYVKLTKNDQPADPNNKNSKAEDRKGHVKVMATDKEGKVLKHVILEVFQKAYVPEEDEDFITLSDGKVEFEAEEGEAEVEITLSNGLRSWSAYPDDECMGWVSAEPYQYVETEGINKGIGHNMVKISVSPNTTGEDRRGLVTVVATRQDNVFEVQNEKDIVKTDIIVIQKAGGGPAAVSIEECKIEIGHLYVLWKPSKEHNPQYNWRGDIWWDAIYEILRPDFYEAEIKVEERNSTWYVIQTYKDTKPWEGKPGKCKRENKLSFEINDIKEGIENGTINNLKLDMNLRIDGNANAGNYWTKIAASNLKCVKKKQYRANMNEPTPKYGYEYYFEGTTGTGMSLSYEDYDFSLVNKDDNKVEVYLKVPPAE